MRQDPAQAPLIGVEHGLEHAFGRMIKAAMFLLLLRPQQARAHHGSKRERDDGRDGDRNAQSDGEFAEQAADNAGHEQQRNENGNQRDAQ